MSMVLKLIESIKNAQKRIHSIVRETPCLYSPSFSKLMDADIWFKLENLQLTGSFKVRGASNKLLSLKETESLQSVVTASTGNHGAAVAFASKIVDVSCTIYAPKGTSSSKLLNMKQYSANIQFSGTDCVEAELSARKNSLDSSSMYISPYNDFDVISGQGTLGMEMVQQCPELDIAIISVGGGGLIGGVGSILKYYWPKLKVMGCSPINSAVMLKSIEAGQLLEMDSRPTLSDGTAGGVEQGSITFPICQNIIDDLVYVSEEEIKNAMVQYMELEHQLLEGAAGTAIAALLQNKAELKGKKIGVIICGGNIGLDRVQYILN